jgi:hypothetical protein
MMPKQRSKRAIGHDQVKAIVGDIDDDRIIAILALNPTLAELEEAAVCAAGDSDVLAMSGRPPSATVSEIVEILTCDEEEPPPVRP